jgi:hypothetical protein
VNRKDVLARSIPTVTTGMDFPFCWRSLDVQNVIMAR